jgi:hypothetical protein
MSVGPTDKNREDNMARRICRTAKGRFTKCSGTKRKSRKSRRKGR